MHHERWRDEADVDVCRVLIAASDHRMRAAMRALVEADGRFIVIAEAHSGDDVVTLDQELHPELIVLDLLIPTATAGLDAVRLLALEKTRPIVVINAPAALRDDVSAAGATAVVAHGNDADTLLTAMTAATSQPPH